MSIRYYGDTGTIPPELEHYTPEQIRSLLQLAEKMNSTGVNQIVASESQNVRLDNDHTLDAMDLSIMSDNINCQMNAASQESITNERSAYQSFSSTDTPEVFVQDDQQSNEQPSQMSNNASHFDSTNQEGVSSNYDTVNNTTENDETFNHSNIYQSISDNQGSNSNHHFPMTQPTQAHYHPEDSNFSSSTNENQHTSTSTAVHPFNVPSRRDEDVDIEAWDCFKNFKSTLR
ncbi:hypothetical protein M422DRAFT_40838 [Sphaerobolus stellatus SS14]|nr:hypothetical protein M422DRAFT_40838 [Sphaerobolus stellatus SS14]